MAALYEDAKGKQFQTGYQEDKLLTDIITSQYKAYNNALHNENTQNIMSHMTSSGILNNLSKTTAANFDNIDEVTAKAA